MKQKNIKIVVKQKVKYKHIQNGEKGNNHLGRCCTILDWELYVSNFKLYQGRAGFGQQQQQQCWFSPDKCSQEIWMIRILACNIHLHHLPVCRICHKYRNCYSLLDHLNHTNSCPSDHVPEKARTTCKGKKYIILGTGLELFVAIETNKMMPSEHFAIHDLYTSCPGLISEN